MLCFAREIFKEPYALLANTAFTGTVSCVQSFSIFNFSLHISSTDRIYCWSVVWSSDDSLATRVANRSSRSERWTPITSVQIRNAYHGWDLDFGGDHGELFAMGRFKTTKPLVGFVCDAQLWIGRLGR